ncbi:MAG TPA: peptide ABC transporter substrate-binding protein [Rhizomicrobium sp.]|nr:peptide ABC transporter substrate-binding protein [Rhizomicrobium sp.]
MTPVHATRLSRRTLIGAGGLFAAYCGAAFAFRGSRGGHRAAYYDTHALNRGNAAEPDTLDPHLASTQYENNILGDLFLGLMTEDAAGNPAPGAATDFAASDDGLVYTFKLRDHIWSDGTPVTAHDYVYSYRRVLDPKTAAQYAAILYPIKNAQAVNAGRCSGEDLGVRALDDRTLQVEFSIEVPYVAQLFTHYATFAVPPHVVQRFGDRWQRPQNMVTNGAYTLKEWVSNDHIVLVRNPRFYDVKNVAIERVYYYPTQDYSAALKRFRAGEIDTQLGVPAQEIGWLKYNMPGALQVTPYIQTQYVLFNFGAKPFDDLRVRTALSLAIDREVIAGRVMQAGERPAYAFVPPHLPGYPGSAQIAFRSMPMEARVGRARVLLAEVGFGPNNPLVFDYNVPDTSDSRLVAVAMQAMWGAVGAQANVVPLDEKNHYSLLAKRDFSVAWAGWVADYRDAKDYLFLCQTSSRDLNNGGYSNPRYDRLIAASDAARDPAARARLLCQAEQIMLDDVALAPVFNQVSRNLISPAVQGWIGNDININRTRYLRLDRSRSVA